MSCWLHAAGAGLCASVWVTCGTDPMYAYGGRLVAPPKPGGVGHRPLGAGTALRRIAAGFLCLSMRSGFGAQLGPLQLGVGVRHGPELVALAMRLALEAHSGWVAVKLDFKNAFNMCSRAAFLRYAARHFPALLLFLLAAYGAPPYITALGPDGWVRFLSQRGCTQGCPLGPFCFAASLQPVLERVRAAHPRVLIAALHDDVEIAGEPCDVLPALRMVIEEASLVCGLEPAGHKFMLYAQSDHVASSEGVAAIEAAIAGWTSAAALAAGECCSVQCDGLVTAGVPIGSMAFVRGYARQRLAEWAHAHDELEQLRDTQAAYLMLRYSLSRRFGFLLRMCGSVLAVPLEGDDVPPVFAHDARLMQSLAYLLTDPTLPTDVRDARALCTLPDEVMDQAILPTRMGGVALDSAVVLWAATHIAGATACLPYLYEHRAVYCLGSGVFASGAAGLPYFRGLSIALTALHTDSPRCALQYPDLTQTSGRFSPTRLRLFTTFRQMSS